MIKEFDNLIGQEAQLATPEKTKKSQIPPPLDDYLPSTLMITPHAKNLYKGMNSLFSKILIIKEPCNLIG